MIPEGVRLRTAEAGLSGAKSAWRNMGTLANMRRRSSLKGENAALARKFWWDSWVSQSDCWTEKKGDSLVDCSVTDVVEEQKGYIGEHKHDIIK